MTSRELLQSAKSATESGLVILHLDATFKLTSAGFPVVVGGVSDRSGLFHVSFMCVTSHRRVEDYTEVLRRFKVSYNNVFQEEFVPSFTMADGEKALREAISNLFPEANTLMCYFHVIKNVREKMIGMTSHQKMDVFRGIYDMHMR